MESFEMYLKRFSEEDKQQLKTILSNIFFEKIVFVQDKNTSINVYGLLNMSFKTFLRISSCPIKLNLMSIKAKIKFVKQSSDSNILVSFDSEGKGNAKDTKHIYVRCSTVLYCLNYIIKINCSEQHQINDCNTSILSA